MWKSLILFFACLLPSWGAGCSASWGNGYTYCRAVTINHIHVSNTTQTNFPVTVVGTLAYLKTVANGGRVQSASGFDITFASDQNGASILKFERAVWSATTGTVEFWLKIPSVSASVDTTFYMFYGKSGVVVDPADPTNVWDANYAGVWHFGDGVTLDLNDSTVNANNGTNHSATACAGQITGAACFTSAGSQYIDVGNNSSLEITGAITIEAWVKYTSTFPLGSTTFPLVASNVAPTGVNGYSLAIHGNDGGGFSDNFYFAAFNSSAEKDITGGFTVVQNTVYSLAATYDTAESGNNAHMILNGAGRNSSFSTNALGASTQSLTFSKWPGEPGVISYWDGFLDEIRISSIARSSDWLLTAYNNTNDPNTFYTIGDETQNLGGGGLRLYVFR